MVTALETIITSLPAQALIEPLSTPQGPQAALRPRTEGGSQRCMKFRGICENPLARAVFAICFLMFYSLSLFIISRVAKIRFRALLKISSVTIHK
jgi:hypothetical protein